MTRAAGFVVALAIACGGASGGRDDLRELDAQLDAAEGTQRRQGAETDELAARAAALRGDIRQVVSELEKAEADYDRARELYDRARENAATAGETSAQAARDFEAADQSYRAMVFVLNLAAGWDAAGDAVCGNMMSTREYRVHLREEGVDLEGVDIDHIWPHARGGADHPWNYQQMPSSLNRSLGASVWEKFRTQPIDVVRGLLVSAVAALRC